MAQNTASIVGSPATEPLASDTKTGANPPNAKPRFHDRLVPLARTAVGKRSLRKIMAGPIAALARNVSASE
jgi:hypothetical protein